MNTEVQTQKHLYFPVKTALAVYNEGREGFLHLSTIDYLGQIYAVGLSCALYGIYQHLGALPTTGPVTLPQLPNVPGSTPAENHWSGG